MKENYYIGGSNGLTAIYNIQNGTGNLYYVHKDYLGSILALTDQNGDLVTGNQFSFDSWGRRRDSDWNFTGLSGPSITNRGFTGHEHIDEFDLINMNGRVYDPLTAQFLSPDNFIQAPDHTQNLNRYTYVLNNPLKYTDPSGELFGVDDALVIFAMAYFSGVVTNVAHAAENGGHPFNPGAWNWNSPSTYIGIVSGALTGIGMVGYQIPTLFPNLDGIITRGALHASTNVGINGVGNLINDDPFFANWGGVALSGFASGAYSGYQLAYANETNYWWGTKQSNWGYNRDQWSIIPWLNKPDVADFGLNDLGAGKINCFAKCLEYKFGETEAYWDDYSNHGDEAFFGLHMQADGNDPRVVYWNSKINPKEMDFEYFKEIANNDGFAMLTYDKYGPSLGGHGTAIKKIKYVPGKRFDVHVLDPYDGAVHILKDFPNNLQGSGARIFKILCIH